MVFTYYFYSVVIPIDYNIIIFFILFILYYIFTGMLTITDFILILHKYYKSPLVSVSIILG